MTLRASILSASFPRMLAFLVTLSLFILPACALNCVVPASGTNATDDAPAIVQAFEDCGEGGTITFSPDTTYYVNTVMNVTAQDATIDIQGTLVVSNLFKVHKLEDIVC